jgi:hypothetical protein
MAIDPAVTVGVEPGDCSRGSLDLVGVEFVVAVRVERRPQRVAVFRRRPVRGLG